MPVTRTQLFLDALHAIRLHPDWDDETVATFVGIKPLELDLVREARKQVQAT